jgi:hypothetical protein
MNAFPTGNLILKEKIIKNVCVSGLISCKGYFDPDRCVTFNESLAGGLADGYTDSHLH